MRIETAGEEYTTLYSHLCVSSSSKMSRSGPKMPEMEKPRMGRNVRSATNIDTKILPGFAQWHQFRHGILGGGEGKLFPIPFN